MDASPLIEPTVCAALALYSAEGDPTIAGLGHESS
jgi:hypothetical protein